jgi:hypothetical protein
MFGANMGEIIRFVSKSERERARLIREARTIYDSVFPPADCLSVQRITKTELPINPKTARTLGTAAPARFDEAIE